MAYLTLSPTNSGSTYVKESDDFVREVGELSRFELLTGLDFGEASRLDDGGCFCEDLKIVDEPSLTLSEAERESKDGTTLAE